jgi:hypothetical protein
MTKTRLPFMRLHYAIAVVAVILIGFGVKLFFFQAPGVEASIPGAKCRHEHTSNAQGLPEHRNSPGAGH